MKTSRVITVVALFLGCTSGQPVPPQQPTLNSIQQGQQINNYTPPNVGTVTVSQADTADLILDINAEWPTTLEPKIFWSGAPQGVIAQQVNAGDWSTEAAKRENNEPFFVVTNVDPNPTPPRWRVRVGLPIALGCRLEGYRLEVTNIRGGLPGGTQKINVRAMMDGPYALALSPDAVAISTPQCPSAAAWEMEEASSSAPTAFHPASSVSIVNTTPAVPGRTVGIARRSASASTWRLVLSGRKADGSLYRAGATRGIGFLPTTYINNPGRMIIYLRTTGFDSSTGNTDYAADTRGVVELLRLGNAASPSPGRVTTVCNMDSMPMRIAATDKNGVSKGSLTSGTPVTTQNCLISEFMSISTEGDWTARINGSQAAEPVTLLLIGWVP